MREIVEAGASWIVVTQGSGPVLASSRDVELTLEPIHVERAVNSIGCGDCLAAGVAAALDEGAEVADAIRVGMAAAAKNLLELLPGRFDPTGVEELAGRIRIGTRRP
jgi:fructose-1-phosphate kinase PfkB-like protein